MIIHGAKPKTDPAVIKERLTDLGDAFILTEEIMHKYDGTQPDSEFGDDTMRIAGRYLQTAFLWAKKAIEDA